MNSSETDKPTLESLSAEIAALKALPIRGRLRSQLIGSRVGNTRVEAAKGWETSATRRILIAAFTYIVIVLFFLAAGLPKPFVNPIVPTVGFLLSTLSLEYVRRRWGRGK